MLVATLASELSDQHLMLATAESCTGGLIASECTALAGSSQWYWGGVVSYALQAKQSLLGVPEDLLSRHGAVSEPVARAMVTGILTHSNAQCAIATTGIAGPGGGEILQPVGTVWFAWQHGSYFHSAKMYFDEENRQDLQRKACDYALSGMLHILSR